MTRQRRNPMEDSQEPTDLFRSIKSKLWQRENAALADDITVDLFPVDPAAVLDTPPPPRGPFRLAARSTLFCVCNESSLRSPRKLMAVIPSSITMYSGELEDRDDE